MAWDFSFLETLEKPPLTHGRLFVSSRGQGPMFLFIHGGFHGAWSWSPWLKDLAARQIPVAALDLRGHGGLQQTRDFISAGVVEMAADVIEAARVLGRPVILVGHSLGALVAMAAAQQVRPAGLVMLAPMPPANVADVKLLPPFADDTQIAPPVGERARKWFLAGSAVPDITPYTSRLCGESPALLNDVYRRSIAVDPAWTFGPALCLSGDKDESPLHVRGQDEAIATFYGATLAPVPGGGHCMMLDDSAGIARDLILDWRAAHKFDL